MTHRHRCPAKGDAAKCAEARDATHRKLYISATAQPNLLQVYCHRNRLAALHLPDGMAVSELDNQMRSAHVPDCLVMGTWIGQCSVGLFVSKMFMSVLLIS